MSTVYTNGGGVVSGVVQPADEITEMAEQAKAAGETWIWLDLQNTNALYGSSDTRFEPLAVDAHSIVAIAGRRRRQA